MMGLMGRLVAGVREAEERLAGLARALQSLYEEEVREATLARDAAARSLSRAQAMEQASLALGQDDLTKRVTEVIEQLRGAYNAAMKRLEELAGIEKTVQMRLTETPAPVPAPALLPSAPPVAESTPGVVITVEPETPAPAVVEAPSAPPPSPPAPPAKETELLEKQKQLLSRIEEIERSVAKWPKEIARLAVQEHVALARMLEKRLKEIDRESEDLVTPAIARLKKLSGEQQLPNIIGFEATDSGDWNKLAANARTMRTHLIEARKKAATKSA